MTLAFFHIGLAFVVLVAFFFAFQNGSAGLAVWNGFFVVANFTYAGYLLSKAL